MYAVTGIITTVAGNGQRGFCGDNGLATAARLARPRGVAADAAGNLFIADASNDRIRKWMLSPRSLPLWLATANSAFLVTTGRPTAAGLDPPAVALDAAGNLFIGDTFNHTGVTRQNWQGGESAKKN